MMTEDDTRRLYRDPGARAEAIKAIDRAISTMNGFIDLTGDEIIQRRRACEDLRAAREVLR